MEEICFKCIGKFIKKSNKSIYILHKDTKIKNQREIKRTKKKKKKTGGKSEDEKSEKSIASVEVHEPGMHHQVQVHSPQHDCVDNSACNGYRFPVRGDPSTRV